MFTGSFFYGHCSILEEIGTEYSRIFNRGTVAVRLIEREDAVLRGWEKHTTQKKLNSKLGDASGSISGIEMKAVFLLAELKASFVLKSP